MTALRAPRSTFVGVVSPFSFILYRPSNGLGERLLSLLHGTPLAAHSFLQKADAIVGSRAHLHLDVIFCISPHLERCTRHRDSSRRALRNICLHLVVIF